MAHSKVTVDIRMGPALAAVSEAVALIRDSLDLIPEWHNAERDELLAKADELIGMCNALRVIRGKVN